MDCFELSAPRLGGAQVGELGAQATPGAVQTLTEPGRRLADYGRRLCGREAVPRHERQRLSITLSQDGKRGQHAPVVALRLAGLVVLDVPALGFEPQSLATRDPSPLGSNHVARDSEQPRQRGLGHIVKPPPDDEERLRNDVVDDLRRQSAPGEGLDRRMVFTEQRIEARSPEFSVWHIKLIAGSHRRVTP